MTNYVLTFRGQPHRTLTAEQEASWPASRSWPVTTTSPPPAGSSCAACTAPATPASRLPKPSCSPRTRSNATTSNTGSASCELSIRARPRATDR